MNLEYNENRKGEGMRSVCVSEPEKICIVDIEKPRIGPYEALVKSEVSFLCNATDRKLVQGHFPGMEGRDTYPLLLGHETAGIVVDTGAAVRNFRKGDRVIGGLLLSPPESGYTSGWGGMSEYVIATDGGAMAADGKIGREHGYNDVFKIMRRVPSDIPVEAAGLLCTWREVLAGFRDFDLRGNEEILVFGAGPVGLSFVKFAKLLGFPFVGSVDPIEEKRVRALSFGADATFVPGSDDLHLIAGKRGKPLDAVIDAVGSERIINSSLPLIRMAGKICVFGVVDAPALHIEKSKAPYNFNLLVHQWPTRDYESEAQEPLCEWIRDGKLDYRDFLSAEFPVDAVAEAFAYAATGKPIKTMLRW